MLDERATLKDRRARVTIDIPVTTPDDYSHVTSDRVTIDGVSGDNESGLRIRFKCIRTLQKAPNVFEIVLTNLNKDHRSHLQDKGVKATLEAGYESTGLARYAMGDVRTAITRHVGTDFETTLRIGDGERSHRYAQFDESFAAGTTARQVIDKLVNAMGLPLGHMPADLLVGFTFDAGYVVSGRVSHALDRVAKGLGYSWSVQDGAVQILAKGETLHATIPQISSDSGLIGSPEFGSPEKKGGSRVLKVKSLLLPARPGGVVNIQSEEYKGDLRVLKVSIEGDTMGGPWYSEIEGTIIRDNTKGVIG